MQKLVVVDVCLQHTGHEVSESVYRHYPQNRRLTTEEEQLVQEPVTELQVNPSLLRNFLQSKTGKPLTAKDIENVVARLKGNKKPDIEQLGEEIKELFRQDPTAAVTLGTNNSNEMELLLIQTSMMAEFYKKFPEVLLLDGTYRTNNLKMALFVFMVVDGNGSSQVVAYCFVSSEDRAHMDSMMQTFVGLQGVEKTKCVIVDKDFKEIRAIRNNFSSDAVVQLCEFHVKKALKRAVTSSKDDADKDRLNSLLVKMIHAPNEEAYDVLKAELDQTASEGFKAYFEKNWHTMQDMWVRYRCDQHFNLGNNTTNRVECHNSKLKAVLKVSDKIHVALKSMLKLHSIKIVESEHLHALNASSSFFTYKSNTDLIQQCSALLTPFATGKVVCEEQKANVMPEASVSDFNEDYAVTTRSGQYVVSCSLTSCTCRTFATMGVVCRHMILVSWQTRRDIDVVSATSSRWLRAAQPYLPAQASDQGAVHLQRTRLKDLDYSTASRGTKYNHALCLLKDIGDLIAECGSEEFTRRMDLIKKLKAMWMANKTVELWNSDCSESDVDFTREPGMDNPGASPGDSDLQQQSIRSRHITPAMSCPTSNMSLDARAAAVSVSMPPTHQSRQDSQSPGLRTPATSLASTPPTHQSCQDSRSPNVRTPAAALASKPPTKQSRQESQSPGLRTPATSLATKPPTHQSCQDSRSPGLRTPAAALASKPPTQQSRQESQSPGLRTAAASLASKPPTQQSCQDSQSLGPRTPAASLASKPPTHQSCQDSRFPGVRTPAALPTSKPPTQQSRQVSQSPGLRTPAASLATKPPTHQSCQDSRSPGIRTPAASPTSKLPTQQSRQDSQFPGVRTPAALLTSKPPPQQSRQVSMSPGVRTLAASPASKLPTQQSRQDSQSPNVRTPAAALASKPPTQQSRQDSQFLGVRTPAASPTSKPPTQQSRQVSRSPGVRTLAASPASKVPTQQSRQDSQFPGVRTPAALLVSKPPTHQSRQDSKFSGLRTPAAALASKLPTCQSPQILYLSSSSAKSVNSHSSFQTSDSKVPSVAVLGSTSPVQQLPRKALLIPSSHDYQLPGAASRKVDSPNQVLPLEQSQGSQLAGVPTGQGSPDQVSPFEQSQGFQLPDGAAGQGSPDQVPPFEQSQGFQLPDVAVGQSSLDQVPPFEQSQGFQLPGAAAQKANSRVQVLSIEQSQGFQLPDVAAGQDSPDQVPPLEQSQGSQLADVPTGQGSPDQVPPFEQSQGFQLSGVAAGQGSPNQVAPFEQSQGFELPNVAGGQSSPDQVPPIERSQGFQLSGAASVIAELLTKAPSMDLNQGCESSGTGGASAAVDHALEGVRVSARKRPQGNPSGSKDSCVGVRFPSRKKTNQRSSSCSFLALPTKEKTLRMLLWFLDEETASDTLKHGYCVQERDISVMCRSLSSGALDTRAPILTLKKYFSRGAWSKVTELMKKKKEQGLWICPKCDIEDDHSIKMISCDLCLEWYHWPCVGISKKSVPTGDWFCESCK